MQRRPSISLRSRPAAVTALGLGVVALIVTACGGATKPAALRTAAATAPAATPPRTITATGQGTAEGSPTLLTITVGVQTSGPVAQTTLQKNNTEAQNMIAKLQADGVATKDLQTSQLSINPNYAQPNPNVPPKLTGYTVSDILTAKIRQLTKAGPTIDDAVSAGGSDATLQSIVYSVENQSSLLASARADAVKQAVGEAQAMAAAAGQTLGPIQAITDLQPTASPYGFGGYPQAAAGSASFGTSGPAGGATGGPANLPAPPVQAGSQVITVQVIVVYAVA